MRIFINELSKENAMCSDTIINQIANCVDFNYFHNESDRHHIVKSSSNIVSMDNRFNYINKKFDTTDAKLLRFKICERLYRYFKLSLKRIF